MRWPKLPEAVLPSFVRGLWDGDGWYDVQKGRYLFASYASASRIFVEGLNQALHRIVGLPLRPIYAQRDADGLVTVYRLRYTTKQSTELIRWLYAESEARNRCGLRFHNVKKFLRKQKLLAGG